jgi:ADP-heptose:LPS heptosyltransferase
LRKLRPAGSGSASDPTDLKKQAPRPPDEAAPYSPQSGAAQTGFSRLTLQHIPRILLIRLRSLGDAILTLPLVEALHAWRPELQLDILIEAPYAPVFSHHPAIHEVLALRARGWPSVSGWTRFQVAVEIRKRHYPAAWNLHGGTTSMFFTAVSGAEMRIGQESHRGSWLYTLRIPPSSKIWQRTSIHTAEHQLSLMRWLELPMQTERGGSIHVDAVARRRVQDRLAQAGVAGYFLIQPTATLATKQWSAGKFAELGDRLFRRWGIPVIYTAAPRSLCCRIFKNGCSAYLYWSDLALDDLFALIDRCRLFIGNDSGPTHAASALHKPVVVIWGSSNFQAWRPWGAEYEAVRSEFPCMPCPGYACEAFGAPKCILDITVAQVIEACERLLSRTS